MAALETIFKVILALAAVAFVGYPFLRQTREEGLTVTPKHEALLERKAQVDTALQEVEFDYRTGKLQEKDFRDLTTRFRREQADVALLLGLPTPAEAADASGAVAAVSADRAETPAAARPVQGVCPSCETPNPVGAKFCGSCGAPLTAAPRPGRKVQAQRGAACAACGAVLRPGNRFCGSCGAKT